MAAKKPPMKAGKSKSKGNPFAKKAAPAKKAGGGFVPFGKGKKPPVKAAKSSPPKKKAKKAVPPKGKGKAKAKKAVY